jgi:amino acid adenylation domain-containing protein
MAEGQEGSIGARLARVARRLPERTAIVEGDTACTYAELDAAADAVAHRIQTLQDARPGFVALLFERKTPAIEAIFGVSRCARAYVPLDAGDPDDRLRLIVRDSEPAVLMSEAGLLDRARVLAPAGCTVIAVDDIAQQTRVDLPDVDEDALANLYYTSGSTGAPKGVSQTQRNVLYFADTYARALGIGEDDRVSLLYTLSFSASMMDMFGALFNGATLYAYDVRRAGVAMLGGWLDRERISVLHAVPTVFRGLVACLPEGRRLEHLRAIDLGGETVFDKDIELFRTRTREDCILINHLAATEANVIAQYVIRHGSACSEGILPVGKSPDGVSVQIRRADGTEADVGEVGNLVVSSPYLSPGYWRRPELDAVAFPADPDRRGARCYFTSDRARIDADGNLHFLGRQSSRVKIRGQSIDLNEVEAALAACPGVEKCAVIASAERDSPESNRLVAYLVVEAGAVRDPLFIRRRLAERLPPYMLPGAFVFLGAMPLTATGKIDRNALARIPPQRDPFRTLDPPCGVVETAVAAMFEQLLNEAPIGRDDDFFLLGGDSLSLVELQSRVLDRFGVSVSRFYEDATVAGIATRIERSCDPNAGPEHLPVLFAIKRSGSAPPMFIVHGRLGQPFVSPHFLALLGDDLPVWAFQARGLDGRDEPNATIESMAADYLSEMRRERPHGPYFIAALCAGALIASVMARALRRAGEIVLPLLLFDPPEARMRSSVAEHDLLLRIKARREEGRYQTPIDDPAYASAAVRAARAFELAIWEHEPIPYDGPVFMLSSRQRMTRDNPKYLKKIFTGPIERFEVGATHAEALDPRTPAFAAHLAHCLERILGEAKKHRAAGDVVAVSALPSISSVLPADHRGH